MIKNISIFGAGYVGLALACMFGRELNVKLIDINKDKINLLKKGISPIQDSMIDSHISSQELKIEFFDDLSQVYDSDLYILALPTDYSSEMNKFDTSILEQCIKQILSIKSNSTILIKSTVPIGFTTMQNNLYSNAAIYFSPEFLREGSALRDCLEPSRIIIGGHNKTDLKEIGGLFKKFSINNPMLFTMNSDEAEAVKLFSNSYLALRISFFNELDSFAMGKKLNAKEVILGVSSDPRIGNFYNNPSFGYGGYCLPKDIKQLKNSYEFIPQGMISASIDSNKIRKKFVANEIIKLKPKLVGIYRLSAKSNSDNFRESSIFKIIEHLQRANINLIIFEPLAKNLDFNFELENDLELFKERCDLIVANRIDSNIIDVKHKTFSRDIFGEC